MVNDREALLGKYIDYCIKWGVFFRVVYLKYVGWWVELVCVD